MHQQRCRTSLDIVHLNNSARDVAISGKARSVVAAKMLECLLKLEDESSIWPWYARVPSESNPADLPSREQCNHVRFRDRQVRASCVDDALSQLFSDMKLCG